MTFSLHCGIIISFVKNQKAQTYLGVGCSILSSSPLQFISFFSLLFPSSFHCHSSKTLTLQRDWMKGKINRWDLIHHFSPSTPSTPPMPLCFMVSSSSGFATTSTFLPLLLESTPKTCKTLKPNPRSLTSRVGKMDELTQSIGSSMKNGLGQLIFYMGLIFWNPVRLGCPSDQSILAHFTFFSVTTIILFLSAFKLTKLMKMIGL